MVVDHAAVAFFDDNLAMRAVGRLSMPIFAFLVVEGFRRTHSLRGYIGRLLIFAFLSQPAYFFAFPGFPGLGPNILFTFALGLLMLHFYEEKQSLWVVAAAALVAELADLNYGSFAILMIFVFYRWDGRSGKELGRWLLLPVFWQASRQIISSVIRHGENLPAFLPQLLPILLVSALAWCSVFFVTAYNRRQGWQAKYLFYIFYPGHLLLIGFLKRNPEIIRPAN